jgi:hypothetical protein
VIDAERQVANWNSKSNTRSRGFKNNRDEPPQAAFCHQYCSTTSLAVSKIRSEEVLMLCEYTGNIPQVLHLPLEFISFFDHSQAIHISNAFCADGLP